MSEPEILPTCAADWPSVLNVLLTISTALASSVLGIFCGGDGYFSRLERIAVHAQFKFRFTLWALSCANRQSVQPTLLDCLAHGPSDETPKQGAG